MAITYEPIATLSGLGTFSSIPQTYTDLRLVGVTASGSQNIEWRYNGDSGTNYFTTFLESDGTNRLTTRLNSQTRTYGAYNHASGFGFYEIDIFSYTGNTFKSSISRFANDNNINGYTNISVSRWSSTSAITSITLLNNGGNPLTLYGIKAA
jgi:hypothetical protein